MTTPSSYTDPPTDPLPEKPASTLSAEKQSELESSGGNTPTSELTFPDGGFRAWLVAAGAGCVLFSTMGYSNSFGIFQAYYMLHQLQDETPDNISWIMSVQMCSMFLTGAVAGPLFDRYGAKVSLYTLQEDSTCDLIKVQRS